MYHFSRFLIIGILKQTQVGINLLSIPLNVGRDRTIYLLSI